MAGGIVTISAPSFETTKVKLIGTSPYMMARFAEKAMLAMRGKMAEGSTAKKGKARAARDFDADYQGAFHVSEDGWHGIPAPAFRNAAIDACRMAGFQMTRAKMSIFVLADGFDAVDGQPLVRLYGEPVRTEMPVRNATGVVDIRVRPMWREWWVNLTVRYDADQFTLTDCVNLLVRAGVQVGVGEGRPFSKSSNGLGYGLFRVETAAD